MTMTMTINETTHQKLQKHNKYHNKHTEDNKIKQMRYKQRTQQDMEYIQDNTNGNTIVDK